jgi:hypothetical protein
MVAWQANLPRLAEQTRSRRAEGAYECVRRSGKPGSQQRNVGYTTHFRLLFQ